MQNIQNTPLGHPTPQIVQFYLKKWEGLDSYAMQERALTLLFRVFCPKNIDTEHVLLKVSVLNDFYSTNIFDKYSVARHIVNLDIDARLANSDKNLVNELAKIQLKNRIINFYSFATKYCNHHNSTDYPIYDSYVEKMLLHFKKTENFTKFSRPELKNYSRFVEIILAFRDYFSLTKYSLREIDIYLWLSGKDAFPPAHAKA